MIDLSAVIWYLFSILFNFIVYLLGLEESVLLFCVHQVGCVVMVFLDMDYRFFWAFIQDNYNCLNGLACVKAKTDICLHIEKS